MTTDCIVFCAADKRANCCYSWYPSRNRWLDWEKTKTCLSITIAVNHTSSEAHKGNNRDGYLISFIASSLEHSNLSIPATYFSLSSLLCIHIACLSFYPEEAGSRIQFPSLLIMIIFYLSWVSYFQVSCEFVFLLTVLINPSALRLWAELRLWQLTLIINTCIDEAWTGINAGSF